MPSETTYFPIFINLANKKALVIGGGAIAWRKILNLLDFDINTVCLSPVFKDEIKQLADSRNIELIRREYKENDVKGFDIVFAATNNPEADKKIRSDCDKFGILLNVADVPDLCTFIMPAYIKRGKITVAISSGGAAPFYAKHLKKRLDDFLPEQESQLAELAAYFRTLLVNIPNYSNEESRNIYINHFQSKDWNSILKKDGLEQAKQIAAALLKTK